MRRHDPEQLKDRHVAHAEFRDWYVAQPQQRDQLLRFEVDM